VSHATSRATSHATSHATALLALPLVLLLSYGVELVLIGVGAFLLFFAILVLQGLEERANERGESLVRHGRSRSRRDHRQPKRSSWHIDEALSTGLEWLAEGKDEADVAAMLNIRTHRGEDLSGSSRVQYEKAMEALREADGWDWVFQAEERWALGEISQEVYDRAMEVLSKKAGCTGVKRNEM
jgi:hypothetical protein